MFEMTDPTHIRLLAATSHIFESVRPLNFAFEAAQRGLSVAEKIGALSADVGKDKSLSASGQNAKKRDLIAKHAFEEHRVRKAAERLRAEVDRREKKLGAFEYDGDLRQAAIRAEMRSRFSKMPTGERLKAIEASGTENDGLIAALLETDNFLSGITDEERLFIRDALIEKRSPTAAAERAQAIEVAGFLEGVANMMVETIQSAGGFENKYQARLFLAENLPDTRHIDADIEQGVTGKTPRTPMEKIGDHLHERFTELTRASRARDVELAAERADLDRRTTEFLASVKKD